MKSDSPLRRTSQSGRRVAATPRRPADVSRMVRVTWGATGEGEGGGGGGGVGGEEEGGGAGEEEGEGGEGGEWGGGADEEGEGGEEAHRQGGVVDVGGPAAKLVVDGLEGGGDSRGEVED